MKAFQDNQGREWSLAIDTNGVKRVRDLLGVDLMEIVSKGSDVLERLYYDPVLIVDVLFVLLKPQADAEKITDQSFGEALTGDAIDRGHAALMAELPGFFRHPRQRKNLTKALSMMAKAEDRALELAGEMMDSPALRGKIEEALKNFGNSFTNSPDSSA